MLEGQYWILKVLIVINLVFIFPLFLFSASNMGLQDAIKHYILEKNGFWIAIKYQSENLFSNIPCPLGEVGCHEGKMSFRLLLPILYLAFNKIPLLVILLQYLLGLLASICFIKIIFNVCDDKILAILIYLSLLFTYTGSAHIFDIVTCADGLAYSFLIFSIYFRQRNLIFLFLSLSFWVDERSIICSGFVLIYWLLFPKFDWNFTLEKSSQVAAVVVSWIVYFMIRWYLSYRFDLSTPSESANFSYLLGKGTFINVMRSLRSIEALWLIVIFSIFLSLKNKFTFYSISVLMYWIFILTVALCVADTSRSMGYGIIGLVISFIIIIKNHKLTTYELRTYMSIIFVINILIPTRYLF